MTTPATFANTAAMIRSAACLLVSLLLYPIPALAGELQVQAPVVNVEPLRGPDRIEEVCPEKPSAGLVDTLRWDLGLSCTSRRVADTRVSGYRVFYRWDNRVYSQVMSSEPGDTIALRVSLD